MRKERREKTREKGMREAPKRRKEEKAVRGKIPLHENESGERMALPEW